MTQNKKLAALRWWQRWHSIQIVWQTETNNEQQQVGPSHRLSDTKNINLTPFRCAFLFIHLLYAHKTCTTAAHSFLLQNSSVFLLCAFAFVASLRVLFRLQTENFTNSTVDVVTIPYREAEIQWMGNSSHLLVDGCCTISLLRNIISWARQFSISFFRLLSSSLWAFASLILAKIDFIAALEVSVPINYIHLRRSNWNRCAISLAALYRHTKLTGSR